MKILFSAIALFFTSIAFSQSILNVITTGNRNKQIVVDNKSYAINNTLAGDKQTVTINDLATGQHTLELVRNNQYNRNTSAKSSFTLREGYDLTITINANGSISSVESLTVKVNNNGRAQLSTNAFNKLQTQVKAKASSTDRTAILEKEFNNSNRRMSAKQASQLIQLVNSESLRLKLAKQSYLHISDRENFSLVSNLLNSTANRNDLNVYVSSIATTDTGDDNTGDDAIAMTTAQFDVIYNELIAEPTTTERNYYLTNFFGRDFNYYTSAQTRKLIESVPGEENRLALAKNAYRGVVDKENYNTVYSLLNNSYSRSQLGTYIATYDNSNPRAAMASLTFDRLYRDISYMNVSSRYTSVNTAFTTAGNYFTVEQAKKLILLVNEQTSRLQLAKTSYKVLVDRPNYLQLNEVFNSIASRNEFNDYVTNFNVTGIGGVAMSETDYNKLYNNVKNSWTSSSKNSQLAEAFRINTNYFTTIQVRQLLALINSESDRLSLAKSAYDNVIDPNNYNQLYDLFLSNTNKNDLALYITNQQNGGGAVSRVAMDETQYNSLYRSMQLTIGIGAKYNSLTELFNTETNYFTVAQAKKLIQLVSSESNRLELAKLSYNNITDPVNFSQLYDIFSSQASKNELINYVNSNAYNN